VSVFLTILIDKMDVVVLHGDFSSNQSSDGLLFAAFLRLNLEQRAIRMSAMGRVQPRRFQSLAKEAKSLSYRRLFVPPFRDASGHRPHIACDALDRSHVLWWVVCVTQILHATG
jgi:hypothetical protein